MKITCEMPVYGDVVPPVRKFNPNHEPSGSPAGGEFASADGGGALISARLQDTTRPGRGGAGSFLTEDPTKMANLPAAHQAAIMARIQDKFPGMTQSQLQSNLSGVLARGLTDPATAEAGKTWYGTAHAAAAEIADKYGYSTRTAVGAVAAMSPQHEWGSNAATSEYVGRMVAENPVVNLDPAQQASVAIELDKRGINSSGLNGQNLADLNPLEQAAVIKAMGKAGYENGGVPVSYVSDETGKTNKATWSCGLNGISAAVRIYDGATPNEVLQGHKVRSFFDNMLNDSPASADHVTIDTHAMSAALGEKVTAQDPRTGYIMSAPGNVAYGTKGAYPAFADAYRSVAAQYNLPAEQAQAIIWLEWRKETGG